MHLLTLTEMPGDEQLLNLDLDNICSQHCAYRSTQPDLGAGQCPDADRTGANEEVDAQHQELW